MLQREIPGSACPRIAGSLVRMRMLCSCIKSPHHQALASAGENDDVLAMHLEGTPASLGVLVLLGTTHKVPSLSWSSGLTLYFVGLVEGSRGGVVCTVGGVGFEGGKHIKA